MEISLRQSIARESGGYLWVALGKIYLYIWSKVSDIYTYIYLYGCYREDGFQRDLGGGEDVSGLFLWWLERMWRWRSPA